MGNEDRKPPPNEAMSDILASIRRIVADEGGAADAQATDEVFVLTPEMRIDGGDASAPSAATPAAARPATAPTPPMTPSPARSATAPVTPAASAPAMPARPAAQQPEPTPAASQDADASAPSLADEAAFADAVRTVLREEFSGQFGRTLTQQVAALVRREIARHEAEKHRGAPDG